MLRYSNYIGKLRTDIKMFRNKKIPWRSVVLSAQDTINGFISTYTFNETTNQYIDEYIEFFNEVLHNQLEETNDTNIILLNHKYILESYYHI